MCTCVCESVLVRLSVFDEQFIPLDNGIYLSVQFLSLINNLKRCNEMLSSLQLKCISVKKIN